MGWHEGRLTEGPVRSEVPVSAIIGQPAEGQSSEGHKGKDRRARISKEEPSWSGGEVVGWTGDQEM